MKKVKFEKKLSLKKQTVANLNKRHMSIIQGGNLAGTHPVGVCTCNDGC